MERRSIPRQAQVQEIVRDVLDQSHDLGEAEANSEQGLDELHAQLVEAARSYEAGPKQQRQAVCDAIIAVTEFLEGQGFSYATLIPLNRVVRAVTEVCKLNQPDPLFCEKPTKTKGKRKLAESVRQGHLAALADAWLKSGSADEGGEAAALKRAARRISGRYFGTVDSVDLRSARNYQRQSQSHELLSKAYVQMRDILAAEAEADVADGCAIGLRSAILIQLEALNAKAEIQEP